jgi:hypothetical protein
MALALALLLRGRGPPGSATADFPVPEPRRKTDPCSWPDNPCDTVLVSHRLFSLSPARATAALLLLSAASRVAAGRTDGPRFSARMDGEARRWARVAAVHAGGLVVASLLVGQTDVFDWAAKTMLAAAAATLGLASACLAELMRDQVKAARVAPYAAAWAAHAAAWLPIVGKPALAAEESAHLHSEACAAAAAMALFAFWDLLMQTTTTRGSASVELAHIIVGVAFVAVPAWPAFH